ncbi:hypothetical protein RRG08_015386 [Elysia crispata]|uniref:Chitin-binding type-2 domain-containing protein n=1 Tax=Elysia crispata TaxID=231223 RepID=A0AAE1D646_9GAST|nr:hypothetical protein RRG08_015386 [Elysia crispata]
MLMLCSPKLESDKSFTAKPKQCEMTTGYLPHEALCNKFIDCSGGKGTVERCPSGTVYATDGQCTTDIHESYCSKYIYGARSRS